MRISDWSSDVCSSDLGPPYKQRIKVHPARGDLAKNRPRQAFVRATKTQKWWVSYLVIDVVARRRLGLKTVANLDQRQHRRELRTHLNSEYSRVGNAGFSQCRSLWWPFH